MERVRGNTDLAGHHDEGGGEPGVTEDLVVVADEGEIEAHRRSRCEVWRTVDT